MKTDSQLKLDVQAEIGWDPAISSGDITITVHEGVVTLHGTVASHSEKLAAERAAQRVSGVRALAMDLSVSMARHAALADADIAAAAKHALDWSVLVPHEVVQATVEKGRVTLNGEVSWNYQREAAEHAVRDLRGVTAVTNSIRLVPTVHGATVEHRIREALERQADREASRLTIDVQGSSVRLVGYVRSWAERDAIAGAAWSSPGVTSIINEIVVTG